MAIRLITRLGVRELRHLLVDEQTIIGTDAECDFVLGDPTVSRRHACVTLAADDHIDLVDLHSRNGIEIDGRRVAQAHGLKSGDRFRIGDVEVRLESADAADAEIITAGMPRAAAEATTPAATLATGPRHGFASLSLPQLLQAAAAGVAFSELAARTAAALVTHGLPGVRLQRGDAVLARAGGDPETDANAATFTRDDLVLHLCLGATPDAIGMSPLASLVLDLLVLAGRAGRAGHADRTLDSPSSTIPASPPASVDPVVCELYRQAAVVAESRLNVLVEGESGTGKELFARYLHVAAGLPEANFVALNCAALPRDLLDAELFGIEAGVATGVAARAGRFEQAHRGTLFLDEIADMTPDTQARLLRVLQEGVVYRIGGNTARPAQARIVSASNRPLKAMVDAGQFRLDLFHRIADWTARLPPLRERGDDIAMLAGQFLERECHARGIGHAGLSRAALVCLEGYEWPGNVRELERELRRVALFLNDGEVVDSERLKPEIRSVRDVACAADGSLEQQLAVQERRILRAALTACDGNVVRAAQKLGIGKSTLYRRMTALGLDS